jgi:hypothetical protein
MYFSYPYDAPETMTLAINIFKGERSPIPVEKEANYSENLKRILESTLKRVYVLLCNLVI